MERIGRAREIAEAVEGEGVSYQPELDHIRRAYQNGSIPALDVSALHN
jgi:hypothetical protein